MLLRELGLRSEGAAIYEESRRRANTACSPVPLATSNLPFGGSTRKRTKDGVLVSLRCQCVLSLASIKCIHLTLEHILMNQTYIISAPQNSSERDIPIALEIKQWWSGLKVASSGPDCGNPHLLRSFVW